MQDVLMCLNEWWMIGVSHIEMFSLGHCVGVCD